MKPVAFGLAAGAFIIIFSHILQVTSEILQALFAFNIFFVCVFFLLNGSLKRKMAVLLIGNFVCFIWNTLFFMFAGAVAAYAGDSLNALLAFLNPLLNLLWIVSFWSISLTFLARAKPKEGGGEGVY